jgi:hypothetical protein
LRTKCKVIPREGYKLKAFENRDLRRIFVSQGRGINKRMEKIT